MESLPVSKLIKHIGTSYLHRLSDDFSIWQHSKGSEIDYTQGYALDDAARGLIAAILYDEKALATTYLQFIRHACCSFSKPVIFFDSNREPLDKPLSLDALGEAYWAVWIAARYGLSEEIIAEIRETLFSYLITSTALRSLAYASLTGQPELVARFHQQLEKGWAAQASDSWPWPEDTLSYANAIFPLALLATTSPNQALFQRSEETLRFLNATCTHNEVPCPIGNEGWYKRTGTKALFVQQPIDPAYQVWANALAFVKTNNEYYKKETQRYMAWFWGHNTAGSPVIDTDGERCFDGIHAESISSNCGAECTVCYLIAQSVYEEVLSAANKSAISTLFIPIQRSAAP